MVVQGADYENTKWSIDTALFKSCILKIFFLREHSGIWIINNLDEILIFCAYLFLFYLL